MDILLKYCEVVKHMDILLKYCGAATNMDILLKYFRYNDVDIFHGTNYFSS